MENCAQLQLAVWAPEQMTMSGAGTSATPGETSSFHTALDECLSSGHGIALGDCSGAGSSMEQMSKYFSARDEARDEARELTMMRSRSEFSSDVIEYEIERSKVHWSELSGLSDFSEPSYFLEGVNRENLEVFAELRNDPKWSHHERGHFFREWGPGLIVGQKIAEGGQASIFEVKLSDGKVRNDILLKVFKTGVSLSDLRKQMPCGILRREVLCVSTVGTMLDDGRFAFLMIRCWGDLRKLIDNAMQEKYNQGPPFPHDPPFPYEWNGHTLHVKDIMRKIALQMKSLHELGIVHRDLKSSNILLRKRHQDPQIIVADFECSLGVVGTGFWRAPEILLAIRDRSWSMIPFNEKTDVYSFAMVCVEVVTGRLPFEGELERASRLSNGRIIEGLRPKLPGDMDLQLKKLIERCWNPNPNERPSFAEIERVLYYLD